MTFGMWPDDRLIRLLGIEHPIIQAPMAGANSSQLAIAVSQAGGLGSLPCAMLDAEAARAAITNRLIREIGPLSDVAPAFPLASGPLLPLRSKAEAAGSADFSPLWSGQAASLGRELPAGELTQRLARETLAIFSRTAPSRASFAK